MVRCTAITGKGWRNTRLTEPVYIPPAFPMAGHCLWHCAGTILSFFAGMAAFGWMVDMPDKDGVHAAHDMPFQLIQGTKEFTYQTDSGVMAVMRDEQQALRALFLMNEMIEENAEPDNAAVPYWGYAPQYTRYCLEE